MVCGCVSASGVGDRRKVLSDLIHHPVQYGKYLIGNNLIFQHGREPKHTANAAKTNLDRNPHNDSLSAIDWPSH